MQPDSGEFAVEVPGGALAAFRETPHDEAPLSEAAAASPGTLSEAAAGLAGNQAAHQPQPEGPS